MADNVIGHLIGATQETDKTHTGDGGYEGILTEYERKWPEEIANDPELARKQSELVGTSRDLQVIAGSHFPKNPNEPGYDPAYNEWFSWYLTQTGGFLGDGPSEVETKREAFYKSLVEQGLSPAQIYANMLQFNADQGQGYWDSLYLGLPPFQSSENFQAQHDYLQSLIDRKEASERATELPT